MPAFFRGTVEEFLLTDCERGLSRLTAGLTGIGLDLKSDQFAAWSEEWLQLQSSLRTVLDGDPRSAQWSILLEYPIPGRQKRIDAVLLTNAGIIVVEFKSGDDATSAAKWQVQEYCWNLRDFHRESRSVQLAPVLCVVQLPDRPTQDELTFVDRQCLVLAVQTCGSKGLASTVLRAHERLGERGQWTFDAESWDLSVIEPTTTVIEFAQHIFGGHDVREIDHAHSDNTDIALTRLQQAVVQARREQKRVICFVTGVPGAGKTLVGLNAAYQKVMVEAAGGAVYFASGNKPLLDVLKAAIVLNHKGASSARREVSHDLTAPVQNVHELVRNLLSAENDSRPPFHAVVFDEAQRVWNAKKVREGLDKLTRRGGLTNVDVERILSHGESEPELLLHVMERCPQWCVVIALVGGGQEIHDGEAGLSEWGTALARRQSPWLVLAPQEALAGGNSNAMQRLFADSLPVHVQIEPCDELHLSVSKRSLRAERYAEWVNLVLDGNHGKAKEVAVELSEFPVILVRDLAKAKQILRSHAGDELRSGLLATSGAARLRADGVEVSSQFREGINYADWFLRLSGDIRSSNQLEVAATEFECQGLELDWCCVCWGGDFIIDPATTEWQARWLRHPKWYPEKKTDTQQFIRNKYRVLLTRARIGVVIFVPQGDRADSTREPECFDATATYLVACGAISSE